MGFGLGWAGVRVAVHLCTSMTCCMLPAGCGVGALFALMPLLFNLKSARLNVPDCESMNESRFVCLCARTHHTVKIAEMVHGRGASLSHAVQRTSGARRHRIRRPRPW